MDTLLREILTSRVYEVARETPLDPAPRLSRRLGNEVLLKREDLQPVFSFKIRGAYNRIARLSAGGSRARRHRRQRRQPRAGRRLLGPAPRPARRHRHAADDAGDQGRRGQGARRGGRAGRRSLRRGAAAQRALAADGGLVFIHPFDDPLVIAGQGTVAVEMLRQSPSLTAVFVPVGGGGLIAGIGAYIKALQPERAGDRRRARGRGRDGAVAGRGAPRAAGRCRAVRGRRRGPAGRRAHVPDRARDGDEIIRVNNDEICAAIKDIFDDTRTIAEPAGALALAGLKSYVETRQAARTAARRRHERRQHELRSAAIRGRAGRARRRTRGAAGGHDPRAARRVPRVLRRARPRASSPSSTTG